MGWANYCTGFISGLVSSISSIDSYQITGAEAVPTTNYGPEMTTTLAQLRQRCGNESESCSKDFDMSSKDALLSQHDMKSIMVSCHISLTIHHSLIITYFSFADTFMSFWYLLAHHH